MIDRDGVLAVWAALGALAGVLLLAGLPSERRRNRLGNVVRRITAFPAGRASLVLAWMWLGWHAFAR
jgi:hypothetical protein